MSKLTALIGYPVAHSLSPRIHEYWLLEHKIDAEYKLLTTPPERVRQVVTRLRKKEALGFNVTIPHKQTVMEFLDSVDATATRIGAVNTVIRKKETLIGTNTDAYGFITHLHESMRNNPKADIERMVSHPIILGAGGATRAIIVALQEAGAKKITVLNRSPEKAAALAEEFAISVAPWAERHGCLSETTLLINATSLGMQRQPPLEISLDTLSPEAAVYDIVYAPLETALLRAARARGNPTVDGLGMLLYQAQKAFESWHGVRPSVTPEVRAKLLEPL